MEVKRFFSTTMQDALRIVREEFGADAVILSNAKVEGGVEIVAALDYEESWEQEPVETEIASRGEPSPSQLARMHAEKHLQLQREMEQAKRKIEAVRSKKYKEPDSVLIHPSISRKDDSKTKTISFSGNLNQLFSSQKFFPISGKFGNFLNTISFNTSWSETQSEGTLLQHNYNKESFSFGLTKRIYFQ